MRVLLVAALVVATLFTSTFATLTTLPLSGGVSDDIFATNVNISYGYLSAAKALFFNVTATTGFNSSSNKIGFVEVDITYNSTAAQTYQFSITPTGLCTFQGMLNISNNAVKSNANPSQLYVTSFVNTSTRTIQTQFQLYPFDLTTSSDFLPTLSVSVGPLQYVNGTAPTCGVFSSIRLNMIAQPLGSFAPLVAAAQIASASTSCVYGSPAGNGTNACNTCFASYTGTACDQLPTTAAVNVTTNASTTGTAGTTKAPTVLKTIVKATLGVDFTTFSSANFVTDTAALLNVTNSSITFLSYQMGSVIAYFYFTDAAIAANPNLVSTYLTKANQTNSYNTKYQVLSVSASLGEATTLPPPSTAAPIGGDGDSGLNRGQVAILVIVIIVIVVIVIVGIVVYVRRSKDGNGNNNRGQSYQGQQMSAIAPGAPPAPASAQKPPTKPGAHDV